MAYFSNSASDTLTTQCYDCPLGAGWDDPEQAKLFDVERELRPCPVAFVQLCFNYDQVGIPKLRQAITNLVNDAGVCQVRERLCDLREMQKTN